MHHCMKCATHAHARARTHTHTYTSACGSRFHSFQVVVSDKGVFATGLNSLGQCGAGAETKSLPTWTHVPVDVSAGDIATVTCGLDHTLLLLRDGAVLVAGWSADGQTGSIIPPCWQARVRIPPSFLPSFPFFLPFLSFQFHSCSFQSFPFRPFSPPAPPPFLLPNTTDTYSHPSACEPLASLA